MLNPIELIRIDQEGKLPFTPRNYSAEGRPESNATLSREEERQAIDAKLWPLDRRSEWWATIADDGSVWAGTSVKPGEYVAKIRKERSES